MASVPADPCATEQPYLGTALLTPTGEGPRKGLKIAHSITYLDIGLFHLCGRNKKQYNLKLATWNVRTLLDSYGISDRPHRRTALIAAELRRYSIDIAALSETRLLHEGSLTEEGAGYTFFWKGSPPGGQHLYGVGLAIKNTLLPSLTETPVGISERLMTFRIPLAKKRYATLLSAFQQKTKYKTLWMHPRSKHWHMIDFIIVRCSDIKDVLITRAMRGA